MTSKSSVITLTFGDVAENANNMQQIGTMRDSGVSVDKLKELEKRLTEEGVEVAYHDLILESSEAGVLVIRGWTRADDLLAEQLTLTPDKKVFMRGQVKNRIARWNLCFSETAQDADFDNKKGTIIPFSELPHLSSLRLKLGDLDAVFSDLMCEGNYYYDSKKCYIGWHGDAERRVVVGARLGPYRDGETINSTFPLHYRWYQQNEPIGEVYTIELGHGDLYIMSEKAVGTDWKKRKITTLRHSAGYKPLE